MSCDNCMADGHFSFQCKHAPKELLESYTDIEVLDYVVYKRAHELLIKSRDCVKSSDSESLQEIIKRMPSIVDYCKTHLSGNALVIKSKDQCETIAPKTNHLHEPKQHTEDDKFVIYASLSSSDSYYVETDDNLSAKALCLVTHLENINNYELETESL